MATKDIAEAQVKYLTEEYNTEAGVFKVMQHDYKDEGENYVVAIADEAMWKFGDQLLNQLSKGQFTKPHDVKFVRESKGIPLPENS